MEDKIAAKQLEINGVVQGVGFRVETQGAGPLTRCGRCGLPLDKGRPEIAGGVVAG